MTNPLEDYAQSKEAAKAQRKQDELTLWKKWQDHGQKPEHLQPLLKLYEPVIAQKVRAWKAPNVPESAFKAELQTHLIKAMQKFDPTRGAALNTWIEAGLPKAMRYNNRYQNLAYIPEGQSGQIGKLQRARDALTEDLGRPPTTQEISQHLGMPVKRIDTILKAVKRDVPMGRSGGENYDYTAGAEHTTRGFEDQQIAVAQNILPEIFPGKPDMHLVFHHTFGTEGHAKLTTGQLAKKLGKTEPQISRMKTTMGNTLRHHMGLDEQDD